MSDLLDRIQNAKSQIGYRDWQAVYELLEEAARNIIRWEAVAGQCEELNYGAFHLVRFDYEKRTPQWIVYRKGFSAFHDDDLEPKYFQTAAQALDACDELMKQEKEKETMT